MRSCGSPVLVGFLTTSNVTGLARIVPFQAWSLSRSPRGRRGVKGQPWLLVAPSASRLLACHRTNPVVLLARRATASVSLS